MHRITVALIAAGVFAAGAMLGSSECRADTLLIERVEATSNLDIPDRGQSMSAVESRFGAPMQRLDPRGGQKSQWPVIHRWVYPHFTVYFERSQVIDVVARKAEPGETGPKPVR